MEYRIEELVEGEFELCRKCDADATVVLIANYPDGGTGYLDEVPLCEDCLEKRMK